jgi:putative cell wall-binding protein
VRRTASVRLTLICALVISLLGAPAASALSRDQVMARAWGWVDRAIPYSQTGWANLAGDTVTSPALGWRRDCSGFVSMSWGLPYPGESTRTLQYRSDPIFKAALQPGDALVSYNNHTVIFGGWLDATRSTYLALEMSSSASKTSTPTPDGTIARPTPYPYWGRDTTYLPYRLRGITGNVDYTPYITPVEGTNRYGTAVAASRKAFEDGSAPVVVVASGVNWPDALGAAALAGAVRGPVLLTRPDVLSTVTANEIRRLGAAEVIVVGDTTAVSTAVAEQVQALGVTVTRIGGADRYETAALIAAEAATRAQAAGGDFDGTVFVTTGGTFPDALAAAPIAYALKRPILLTRTDSLPLAAADALTAVGADRAVILGGSPSVSTAVETRLQALLGSDAVQRIAGPDRYATGWAVARYGVAECGLAYTDAAVAVGSDFPDALAGGPMAGELGSVVLLTRPDRLEAPIADAMLTGGAGTFGLPHCLGGETTLLPIVRESIALALRAL